MANQSKIKDHKEAFNYINELFTGLEKEKLVLICLDKDNYLLNSSIKDTIISEGFKGRVKLDVRLILKKSLLKNAYKVILCHNHPPGCKLEPTQEDIILTKEIKRILKLVDIKLIDHLIISGERYNSLKVEKII